MSAEPFITYAQNAEDVVLWRALRDVVAGTYVDVGAADPRDDSVTMAFYQRRWTGVNVEPVPALAASLTAARPRDQTFQLAAGASPGTVELFVTEGTGRSTVVEGIAAGNAADGLAVESVEVEVLPLDEILERAGFDDRPIHFCKIDVEGAEADVLAGFDLGRWRPWVLVIEATAPQSVTSVHEEWEPTVLAAGYTMCLFDGLNRFYASPDHPELAERLSYPACVFDQPYLRADVDRELQRLQHEFGRVQAHNLELAELRAADLANEQERLALVAAARGVADAARSAADQARRDALAWRHDAAMHVEEAVALRQHAHRLATSEQAATVYAAQVQELLDATVRTVSWRVTSPLRVVRRAQRRSTSSAPAPAGAASDASGSEEPMVPSTASMHFLARRLQQATALLSAAPDPPDRPDLVVGEELQAFEDALGASDAPSLARGWLACAVVLARFPSDAEVDLAARLLRRSGPHGVVAHLFEQFSRVLDGGQALERELHIVHDGILVDVTHTAAHDLHTGIQHVVREMVSRWLDDYELTLVSFDFGDGFPKALTDDEATRMRKWRNHLHTSGSELVQRRAAVRSDAVVVPWGSRWLLPELGAEPPRCDAYRALARAGVTSGFGVVGYDLIPMTATETVNLHMSANFANYLSAAKHATQLSAISESTARDFRAFGEMLASQGLSGPKVVAHPLPSDPPPRVAEDIDHVRRALQLGSLPLLLVVGSHEPRKNHVAVLEAADAIWADGGYFHVLMIGGSGWSSGEFDDYLATLRAKGRPITVWKRAGEDELNAAYHLARFTVFPSLVEGYGLPITESLACGTPVITSSYGSMAEAAMRGALLVDPRDVGAIEGAMRSLLTDDDLLARLSAEALANDWGSWDQHADLVWQHLTS